VIGRGRRGLNFRKGGVRMGGGQPNSAHSTTMSMQQVFSSSVDCRRRYSKSLNLGIKVFSLPCCVKGSDTMQAEGILSIMVC
jgi:hypothetical protein